MFTEDITTLTHDLFKLLQQREYKMVTAESCTGGLISAAITEIPGSSDIFDRSYVTYSNDSKIELLTVPTFFIEEYGAVSHETAIAMAEGALLMSKAQISISVTGVAGPDGGTLEKPVGTVYIACATKDNGSLFEQHLFTGSRHQIRMQSVTSALKLALKQLV